MEREARLRYAKSSDLDRITEIGLAASATDPLDQYRYPFSNLYPQDHEKLLRTRFRRYLWDAEVGACKVMVAEFFQEGTKGAYVVGYAIWETNERYAQSDKPQKGDGKSSYKIGVICALFTYMLIKGIVQQTTWNLYAAFIPSEPTTSKPMLSLHSGAGMTANMGETGGICDSSPPTQTIVV